MNLFNFTVASPEGKHFEGEIAAVYLRGCEGDFAILAGHTPFATVVKPCEMRIEFEDCSEKKGNISGGMLMASKENVILLTSTFVELK